MQPDVLAQWPVISRLLDEALALDEHAQRAWLDALPAEHAELRPILERLLSRRTEAEGFFDRLPADAANDSEDDPPSGPIAGSEVGPYRLVRMIGRGGMGTVWLAHRIDSDVKLPVAIKLPSMSGAGEQIAERFDRERQILAALNHPNIARLYEAGVSKEGQPYLALEYVEGESLPAYCEAKRLSVRKRLQLFLQVLRAVQYAHASLVIHRDLKPSNIIVTPTGEVKLLDFGIAKLVDRHTQRTELTELTQAYGRMMTLDYASPEQVLGEPLTTATDVYSLGVVLFDLLTGTKPYRIRRGTRAELEEAILSGEITLPSQAVTQNFVLTAPVSLAKWRRALRGDLDTIVMKALERDRAVRYHTVDAFAQDCENYLRGRPVLAQPRGAFYRFSKFIARHRVVFGAGIAVALALIVGTGVAIWQAQVAVEHSHIAGEEARKARAVQSFLTALFDKNTRLQPDAAKARSMTVRELLLEASDRVQSSFEDTPTVKLELLTTVSRLLREMDEYERAATLNRQAIALAREHGLTNDDAYVESLMGLATLARLLGRAEEAVASRDESLRVLDARGDHTSMLRARAAANTVAQMAPDPQREIALVKEAARLFAERYPGDPGHFNVNWVLGNLYRTQQSPVEAITHFQRAIDVFARVGSRDFTNFGASHAFLGQCEFDTGKVSRALESYTRGLELLDRHAGPNTLVTRFHRGNFAAALHHAGRVEEAHRLFDEVRRSQPPEGPTVVDFDDAVYQSLAFIEEGRLRESQALLETFASHWVEFGKRFVPNGYRWVSQLAMVQALQGRGDAAKQTLLRVSELPQQNYGREASSSPQFVAEAAWVHLATGDLDAARALIANTHEYLQSPPVRFDMDFVRLATHAADIALKRGQTAEAVDLSQRALDHLRSKADPGGLPFLEARALAVHGNALLAAGELQRATAHLESAVEVMRRLHSAESPWLLEATATLGLAHRGLNNDARAAELLAAAEKIAHRHASLTPVLLTRLQQLQNE